MTRRLRSNFPRGSYLWAVRNAQWQGMGIPEEDCEKPKIAIVNSSSGLAACFAHLDGIVPVLKDAIRAAGGVPFEIRTAAPSDFVIGAGGRGGYILATRDLVTNDIEVAVEGAQLDGMVCLTSCDKTVPGQMMAAGRLNIPTLMVACGYQPSGEYQGQHVDIEDVFVGAMHAQIGRPGRGGPDRHEPPGDPRARRLLGHGHGELDAHRQRGAGHGAARQHAGRGQQPDDDGPCARRRRAHRADGLGRPQAARHPHAAALSPTRCARCWRRRLDQLRQASAGGGHRGAVRVSTSTACSRSWRTRCRCSPACVRWAIASSRSSRPPAAAAR